MVDLARIKVLETLDPRRDRVTLKVDIDWTAHSHIIGKSGASIQAVMDQTGCHVHFPDANRTNNNEKSNQVSIAGTPDSVREARLAIRDLLPVILWFTVALKPTNRSVFLVRINPVIQLIERFLKIQITVRFSAKTYSHSDSPMITVLVRGVLRDCNLVQLGTDILLNLMDDCFVGDHISYQMNVEVAQHHHSFLLGSENSNVKSFMATTGTILSIPDNETLLNDNVMSRLIQSSSEETANPRKTTINLKGSAVSSVLKAFQLILLNLPLTLTFDLKEGQELETRTIEHLSNHYKVCISVKPKPKQKSKTIWIKAAEKDEEKLFQVRQHLIEGSELTSQIGPTLNKALTGSDQTWSVWSCPLVTDKMAQDWGSRQDGWNQMVEPLTGTTGFDKAPGAERPTARSMKAHSLVFESVSAKLF